MTLEEVLQLLGSKNPFLKEMKIDSDGYRHPFTKSGSAAYDKLITILYAVGDLTDTNVEHIVDTLDSISNELF